MRARIRQAFAPLPTWYPPFEGELIDKDEFPYHALTQRPAAMYHSWGSQNAWLRQIHGANPLYVPGNIARKAGLEDGDWAWVTSHHGRIRVPVQITAASNEQDDVDLERDRQAQGRLGAGKGAPETESRVSCSTT
jgi:anaerobic selenocysteine-containing dehydrogenase